MFADNLVEYDSEGSESDDDDELEGSLNGMYAEQDSDDEDTSDDSDEADEGFVHRSSVIIEDVSDGEFGLAQVITATKVTYKLTADYVNPPLFDSGHDIAFHTCCLGG